MDGRSPKDEVVVLEKYLDNYSYLSTSSLYETQMFPSKTWIMDLKKNCVHVIHGPTKRNQEVVECYTQCPL